MTTTPHAHASDAANPVTFREDVRPGDPAHVRRIVGSTGYFHPPEIEVAVELVTTRLAAGPASGYAFIFAERGDVPVGYTCFGEIPCTTGSYDLYWIAVTASERGRGLGRRLLEVTEARITARGGRRVYIETSGRALYEPTRQFYLRCGYRIDAVLADFYAPGDSKVIFVRELG
jgi:GNAT superfamily N-acetyltransferase